MVFTTDEPPSGVGGPTYPCQQGEGGKDGPPGHLVQGRPEKVTLCLCQRSVYHSPLCGDRSQEAAATHFTSGSTGPPKGESAPAHAWASRPRWSLGGKTLLSTQICGVRPRDFSELKPCSPGTATTWCF